ncbi:recombination-associated protein RdgC [Marinibactrum halimedae]|uniref:Recombination-associated protein RdgC n=1 Tax=Marinibactrum halimedae TaxID=1444977 RepID=A0AA37WM64_9GAMM|nr:recombination-associated protein RdgC [Marinibactrum halimedae]MCD9458649.1 recombination-associated protein RdgC [Marinibactrum halimedae]GLS25985.1 recombination-associated protein RdgC [Marinibactrum halimedae]
MWFKNIQFYRLASPFQLTEEELEKSLEENKFTPCGRHDLVRYGWISPLGKHSDRLLHASSGCILLCTRKQEKVLPASAIKELVNEKVDLIEQKEDRKVYRKEKDAIKEDVIQENLPNALCRTNDTYAYIDLQQQWIVIDSSSANKAEELVSYLRKSIGSFPAIPCQTTDTPAIIMTQWLSSAEIPSYLLLGTECEMKTRTEEGSLVQCKNQDLLSEEIQSHIDNGKEVSKLALTWRDKVSFVAYADLSLKRMKFGEELIEESSNASDGDPIVQFDTDLAIMSNTIRELLSDILEEFGGIKQEAI